MAIVSTATTRIQVHGHRGARALRPENTLAAFQYAIDSGVDVLELDMAVTLDQHLVVSHDLAMSRRRCLGPEGETALYKLTLEQVKQWDCGTLKNKRYRRQVPVPGERVATLDEVFALAPQGQFGFNIETKINARRPELSPAPEIFARLVAEAVRRHGLEKRVIVQSFDYRTLKALRGIAPEIALSALYAGLPRDFRRINDDAGGVEWISPHHLLVTQAQVRRAHEAGLKVVPWTANRAGSWRKLAAAHVDAIITDDPAALIEYLQRRGLR